MTASLMELRGDPGVCGPGVPYEDVPGARSNGRRVFRGTVHEATLARDGSVVVPLLDAGGLERIRAIQRDLGPAPDDARQGFFPGNNSSSLDWKRAVVDAVAPVVAPRITELFHGYRPYFTTFLTKWPGPSGELQLHQDPTMVGDEGWFRGITLWCPLDDLVDDLGHGCGGLHVVPGSHRLPIAGWCRARDAPVSGLAGVEDLIYTRHGIPPTITAGEAVAWDHRGLHYSPANRSSRPRVALAIALRPEEADNVHVELTPAGTVDIYRVDDRYFLENPPTGQVDYPLLHRLDAREVPVLDVSDLERAGIPTKPEIPSTCAR